MTRANDEFEGDSVKLILRNIEFSEDFQIKS